MTAQFDEWYDVLVTGTIVSETPNVHVTKLAAVVATVYDETHPDYDYFKVWPKDSNDPQLPKDHDGKLWFQRSEAAIQVVSNQDGNPT